ncbi:MAG: hypothetical protein CMI54_02615 [Parcubacteria group bacterium]|nr:hypothetical protein [Parcubacteria group bacterium]|tara:strand:- start:22 stop:351 length:330 start_codon:yes stop_codon:yes gene_type:complete
MVINRQSVVFRVLAKKTKKYWHHKCNGQGLITELKIEKKKMYKIHNGCSIDVKEVVAVWSEKYIDPRLDSGSYLVRAFLRNNSTILTLANFPSKDEADSLVDKISNIVK